MSTRRRTRRTRLVGVDPAPDAAAAEQKDDLRRPRRLRGPGRNPVRRVGKLAELPRVTDIRRQWSAAFVDTAQGVAFYRPDPREVARPLRAMAQRKRGVLYYALTRTSLGGRQRTGPGFQGYRNPDRWVLFRRLRKAAGGGRNAWTVTQYHVARVVHAVFPDRRGDLDRSEVGWVVLREARAFAVGDARRAAALQVLGRPARLPDSHRARSPVRAAARRPRARARSRSSSPGLSAPDDDPADGAPPREHFGVQSALPVPVPARSESDGESDEWI